MPKFTVSIQRFFTKLSKNIEMKNMALYSCSERRDLSKYREFSGTGLPGPKPIILYLFVWAHYSFKMSGTVNAEGTNQITAGIITFACEISDSADPKLRFEISHNSYSLCSEISVRYHGIFCSEISIRYAIYSL